MKTLPFFACLLAFAPSVSACDSCALFVAHGDGLVGFNASVAHQFTRFGSLWQGSSRLPNPVDQYLDSSITQLTLGYTPGPAWQFQATLPYIVRTYRRPEHALIETGRVAGIGDATLAIRRLLLDGESERGGWSLAVLGGVEFGTGDAADLGDEVGGHFHHHANFPDSGIHGHDLALGSGSTDYILGGDGQWRIGRTYSRGSLQYKLRRPGRFGYRFADETSWEAALGRFVSLAESHSVALEALWSAERKGLDRVGGVAQLDTGFSAYYLGCRVRMTVGHRFSAEAAGERPVRERTSETMVVPDYRLRISTTWRF